MLRSEPGFSRSRLRFAERGVRTAVATLFSLPILAAGLAAGLACSGAASAQRGAVEIEQPPTTLRILSYNIKHGLGMDGAIDLERIARVINDLHPDVVTLQEVDSAVERTSGVDQTTVLGKLTGMHSVFGTFFDYQGGRYGMALLSKYPFISYTNHLLPKGVEHRAALAGRIRVGEDGPEVVVVGIHLVWTGEERYSQAARLIEIFQDEKSPVILAGDFNSRPDSDVMALVGEAWHIPDKGEDHFTFPSDAPDREIDYIVYRPSDRFEVVEHRVVDEPVASDHRPLLLELRFK
ncbi:MAG: endonuclease/exonuclease/phosphatase family protein [Gemmatimonadales bacterium]|jgi:endonuclease/exonuclease/phosphatase family metal-dependent hydrolase